MSTQDILDKGSVQQAEQADQAATGSSDAVDGAMSEEEKTRQCLAEERMNRTMSLPECVSLRLPRAVSYAEVGDPSGYPAFLLLGMDSHRYMSLMFDKAAKARGVRLICLDRPGRGRSSHFEDQRANRVLQFPGILRLFCRAAEIRHFSLVGQSVGASYALRCAQEMPDMVATTIYLISPWVPLSVSGSNRALYVAEKLPQWVLKAAMTMPRLLIASGSVGMIAKGCSEEERLVFGTNHSAEVLLTVSRANECTEGVALDALVALEKNQPMGFDYRDVSMPVHVFHGTADHMVPIKAAKWMAEEMPACTLSAKMGGTHALVMDAGVLNCVLEFMSEDFKYFEEHAADRADGEAASERGPAFSFPKHTFDHARHLKATGYLSSREGMLIKAWNDRYFVLEGFQLHEYDGPGSSTARRVVDLRGTVAHAQMDEGHAADPANRLFRFKLVDAKHRVLYSLGANTTEDRSFWTEILTKASRFSMGSGDEHEEAVSKPPLVSTAAGGSEGVAGGSGGGGGGGGAGGGGVGELGEGVAT